MLKDTRIYNSDGPITASAQKKAKKTKLVGDELWDASNFPIQRNSPNSTNTTSTPTIGDTVFGNIINANGEVIANFIAQYITQSPPSECSTTPGGCFHSLTDAEECSIDAYANATKIDGAHNLTHDHNADGKWQIYILDKLSTTDTNTVYMHDEEGGPFACSNLESITSSQEEVDALTQLEVDALNQVLTDVLKEQLVLAAANNTTLDANTTTTGEYESLSGDSTTNAAATDTTNTATEGEVTDVTPTPGFDPNLPIPAYLAPLPESDPQWASLNSSAYGK